jgi:hypothetical protein
MIVGVNEVIGSGGDNACLALRVARARERMKLSLEMQIYR